MDSDWSLWEFIDTTIEVVSSRKTFMNFDPVVYHYLYCVVILAKSCVAGYGMLHVLPKKLTYIFLCVQFFLHFIIRDEWRFFIKEMFNFFTHICIIEAVEGYQTYTPSFPNILVWYYNCSFNPSEFFLDIFMILVLVYAIWKSYCTRPHKLSAMMCVLFAVNWVADYFSSAPPTDTFTNMIFFYVPQVLMESLSSENELHAFPQACGAVWVVLKWAHSDLEKSPAGRFVDYLNIKDWTFTDYLDAVGRRKSFLNVDQKEHFVMFYVLLLLKSVMASYSTEYLIGVFPTLKLLLVNFLFSTCDRNIPAVMGAFIRSSFLGVYQYVSHFEHWPIILGSGIWYFVCCDNHLHFLLDFYLIVSAFVYIDNAYRGSERMYSLLWFLYMIDWFADVYVGQHLSTIATIATLYIPVALISSSTALNIRTRIYLMLVFIALWLAYKQEKEIVDYSVNKYILNFYEISTDFIAHLGGALSG